MKVSVAALTLFSSLVAYSNNGVVNGQAACPYDPMNDPMGMMEWLTNNCRADQADVMLDDPCCFITPPLKRISATTAFDAYQNQSIDSKNGVLMIDVRAPDELYWTGQPSQVTKIDMKASVSAVDVEPHMYKTVLKVTTPAVPKIPINRRERNLRVTETVSTNGGTTVTSKAGTGGTTNGGTKGLVGDNSPFDPYAELVTGDGDVVKVKDVEGLTMSPIAYNVPVETYDSTTFAKNLNTNFGQEIMQLIMSQGQNTPQAIIFYCRSGSRSSVGCYFGYCYQFMEIPQGMFTFYEVEAADEMGNEINGYGGFEGSSYKNKFNGYRGFPGRPANDPQGVDFKDAGLPIMIGQKPLNVASSQKAGAPWVCKDPTKAGTLAACQ